MSKVENEKRRSGLTAPILHTVKNEIRQDVNKLPQPKQQAKRIKVNGNILFVKSYPGKKSDEIETSFNQQPIKNHKIQLKKIKIFTKETKPTNSKLHPVKARSTVYKKILHEVVGCLSRKSNVKAIVSKKETRWNIVKEFCCSSTIDGIQYTVRKKGKWFWVPFFIFVASYCVDQCKLNVGTYLKYHLSTKITYKPNEISEFPAITICPMRMHKKSTCGNAMHLGESLSCFYGNSLLETLNLIDENRRSCDNHNNWTLEMREAEFNRYVTQINNGHIWISNEFHITYQDILLKCFWDSININCSDAFLNHITDISECFTFNPGDGIARITNSTVTGFGLNFTEYRESHFKSHVGQHGLKLIFNIKQSEYCGTELTKRGAGLFFQIHGTDRNPSFLINPSTYISPGYDTTVVIDKQIYERRTEHLGHCKYFVPLYLTPDVNFYVLEHCYMQCVSDYILRACKCYPPNLGALESIFRSNVANLNVPMSSIRACLGSDYVCLKEWIHVNMSKTSFHDLCPYCKQPCSETKYSIQMTRLLLSKRNLLDIHTDRNVSVTELRKNFLIVRFVLKASDVQLIIEEQAFNLQDLFIYIGNNIGLYLGMSFTTMFELVYFIFRLLSLKHGKHNVRCKK